MAIPRWASKSASAAPLAQPLRFHFAGRTAPNRLMKAATTERLASWQWDNIKGSGTPTPELLNLYKRWGEGGYGVVVSGNIMIAADHIEAPGNLILDREESKHYTNERFQKWKELAEVGKAHGSLMLGQLNHPGRQIKLELQKNPIGASDIPLGEALGMQFGQPRAATEADIKDVVNSFANASEYLSKAGWDGVQLHAAHGYLVAQFLSPTTNNRTDKYGGSFENRCRILLESCLAIRSRVPPDFILSVKINSVEFQEGGFTTEEAAEMCKMLEEKANVDFVELSGGTYVELAWEHKRESTKKREAFFLEFADQITPKLSKTKSYVTGGMRTVDAMIKALDTVDGIGLARPTCQEPGVGNAILRDGAPGVILGKLDDSNFMLTNVASGTQMGQIGNNYDPIDLTKQENADGFLQDLGVWVQEQGKDKDMKLTGFVNVKSVPQHPYGTTNWY